MCLPDKDTNRINPWRKNFSISTRVRRGCLYIWHNWSLLISKGTPFYDSLRCASLPVVIYFLTSPLPILYPLLPKALPYEAIHPLPNISSRPVAVVFIPICVHADFLLPPELSTLFFWSNYLALRSHINVYICTYFSTDNVTLLHRNISTVWLPTVYCVTNMC